MTDILALEQLYTDVKADFTEDSATTAFAFGRKEVTKQINQGTGRANRIVFVPGLYPSGDLGKDLPPRNPGRNPRSIATLGEVFTVFVWAYDGTAAIPATDTEPAVPAAAENEFKQYKAARLLYDDWRAALYRATHKDEELDEPTVARVTILDQRWVTEKNERRFGAEIQVVCVIEAMVPDAHSASEYVAPPIAQDVDNEFATALP